MREPSQGVGFVVVSSTKRPILFDDFPGLDVANSKHFDWIAARTPRL